MIFTSLAIFNIFTGNQRYRCSIVVLNCCCRLLAESLGYKEDSTDCAVPCTPPRTEEDIYNSLDADFFPKKDESNPLLKEILFKDSARLSPSSISSSCVSSSASTCSSSSLASSPAPLPLDYEKSSLRDLLFRNNNNNNNNTSNNNNNNSSNKNHNSVKETSDRNDRKTSRINTTKESTDSKSDHQLLREVLRDTSFQRKYNLRPLDLGAIGTGFVAEEIGTVEPGECVGDLAREQIEPVLSLAIQQLQKDFDNTCVALGIHPGKFCYIAYY